MEPQDSRAKRDRAYLEQWFPAAFGRSKRPLKLGIHHDVIAAGIVDEYGNPISANRIRNAVRDFVSGPRYAKALLFAKHRIDLHGNPVEPVLESHRARAYKYLASIDGLPKRLRYRSTSPNALSTKGASVSI